MNEAQLDIVFDLFDESHERSLLVRLYGEAAVQQLIDTNWISDEEGWCDLNVVKLRSFLKGILEL